MRTRIESESRVAGRENTAQQHNTTKNNTTQHKTKKQKKKQNNTTTQHMADLPADAALMRSV